MPVQDVSLNFEDLLETVKESERGRWFISEFESRLRKSDTGNILAAIAKLEGVIASQSGSGVDSLLVARARSAIAAARQEISGLDRDKRQLTEEGRLFAKLADMARASFASEEPSAALVSAGVSRALLLVDQLDQDFASVPGVDAKTTYFAPDADVFEAPKAAAPRAPEAPSLPKPVVKDVERGARLLIRKAGEPEAPLPAVDTPAAEPAAAAPAPVAESAESAAPPARQSRVIIIRRKPEELLDVPLLEENSSSSAA